MSDKEFKTTNPFIAAVADQSGEMVALDRPDAIKRNSLRDALTENGRDLPDDANVTVRAGDVRQALALLAKLGDIAAQFDGGHHSLHLRVFLEGMGWRTAKAAQATLGDLQRAANLARYLDSLT